VSEYEQLNSRLTLLGEMMQTDGWKLYEQQMKAANEQLYIRGMQAETPHAMAKLIGGHDAVKQLLSWPVREMELCRNRIKELQMSENAAPRVRNRENWANFDPDGL
jgi:hypothetical protein